MPRSLKKGPYVFYRLLKKITDNNKAENKVIVKTYSRSSVIVPEFIGNSIAVYNGKKFILVYIVPEMVGHKLGEFSPTRKFGGHAGSKNNKKDKKGGKR